MRNRFQKDNRAIRLRRYRDKGLLHCGNNVLRSAVMNDAIMFGWPAATRPENFFVWFRPPIYYIIE